MKKYIKDYVSDFEKELNIPLMTKEADIPLVEYVMDAWRSLEIVKNIKIIKFEYNDNESELDINGFLQKREKKKKKKDRCDYKIINDNRYGCLTVHIRIDVEEIDPNTKETKLHRKIIKKQMLIPYQDEDGYFYIKGKKYYCLYQLLDKSTYTSSSSVTLKSLMPVAVKRVSQHVESIGSKSSTNAKDLSGLEFNIPVYHTYIFKKETPIMLFYLSHGLDWAMSYLGVSNVISFLDNTDNLDMEKNLYFQISSKCTIEVNKEMFMKYPYIQSIIGGILEISTNRVSIEDLHDKEFWIKKLSNKKTVEKGNDVLVSFNRMMDETTKKILMLSENDKTDIYAILRWMMQNFNALRLKDNMSMDNKRLRCNEYIASLLTLEFSDRLTRNIITRGAKATMDDYVNIFKFSGEILLQKMHSSGILRFDDTINDMDFFSRFKYTTKGPHSFKIRTKKGPLPPELLKPL